MVDLRPWLNEDKNFKANPALFVGTTIQNFGLGKGYSVQMLFLGMAIPSKLNATFEDAQKMEAEVWAAMGGAK